MLLIVALMLLAIAVLRLFSYRRQIIEMARILEETPAESNLPLTVQIPGTPARRLCRAINARLEAGRRLRLEMLRGERELKYTMACISHDIRTPLAGAMGYLQLLDKEPRRQPEYLPIIKKRLQELDELLTELFLYTRLLNNAFSPECENTAALPPLWEALAEFYPQLEDAGIQPHLCFDKEEQRVWANPEALGRVYRNLIANALRHGGGGLTISAADNEVCFSNPLGAGPRPDPDHLFDRFYQSSPAREKGGAGLGLSIVRKLMEQMEGRVFAQITENELQIHLLFLSQAHVSPPNP
ncbi:MAG: HAMP domain-containing histidine kinase [Lachnospiraceae bacterium]|nr:HAMP domain-containing histidine kinase [Lachnospiraceae bacterium]